MAAAEAAKAAGLLFLAAVVQASLVSAVIVTLVGVALLRGSFAGALGGFFAGLVLDTATLSTLGLSSLLLTLAGYWIGRYGETTGRDRAHAPFVSVGVVTILYGLGSLMLHFVLGEPAPARAVLVDGLLPAVVLNLLLTAPVYAIVRRVLRPVSWTDRTAEVRLLG
jgi:rod shape-determining protein MreD